MALFLRQNDTNNNSLSIDQKGTHVQIRIIVPTKVC